MKKNLLIFYNYFVSKKTNKIKMFSRFIRRIGHSVINHVRHPIRCPITGITGLAYLDGDINPLIIHNNRINMCYTNKNGIKRLFDDPISNKILYEKKQVIVDYHQIKSINDLDKFINNIEDKEIKCLIICDNKLSLSLDDYKEEFFECLDKYKDQITIIYLCRSERIYGRNHIYV